MEFFGQLQAGSSHGHLLVPQQGLDSHKNLDILVEVIPPVGAITLGFQLWELLLPLAQGMNGQIRHFSHFADTVPPLRNAGHGS
jgi:hypothetical protein